MKFFKTLKRKAGNAILPVVGTIFALTVLAGTVVGVALHSSKLVYKQDTLEQQDDARQILYIASRYFCAELNKKRSPDVIAQELKGFFGQGLKVTQDKADPEKFYIWYPNKYKTGKEYTTDDNVAEWLKATIKKTDMEDDDGDHGNNGINNTLFKEEAKLDEKYSIGNMMTVYMSDEGLLPGRRYSINEVSLVESDIDTFDEAFTYMNNTGVLEIDDIAVALYKLKVLSDANTDYIDIKGKEMDPQNLTSVEKDYAIVYKTGNLGGNYTWLDGDTTTDTWIYRQEYDLEMLTNMCIYFDSSLGSGSNKLTKDNITYRYDEVNDRHYISSTNNSVKTKMGTTYNYTSSRKFAEALADYIFWNNIPLLCMNIDEVEQKFYQKHDDELGSSYSLYYDYDEWVAAGGMNPPGMFERTKCLILDHDYEWTNEGLSVYVYFLTYQLTGTSLRYYRTHKYTSSEIENFLKNSSNFGTKYNTSQKIYDAVKTKYESQAINHYKYEEYAETAINFYKNDENSLKNDLINNIWGENNGFTNVTKQTTTKYYKDELRVRRYNRRTQGWREYYEESDSGAYYKNSYYNEYYDWNTWNNYYNNYSLDYPYFRDSSFFLNPNFYSGGSTKSSFEYKVSVANNNRLVEQVIEYLTGIFKKKMAEVDSITELPGNGDGISSGNINNYSFEGFAADGDQLIYMPQVFHDDANTFRIQYRYKVILREIKETKNGTNKYVSKFQYTSKDWLDNVYLSNDEFYSLFAEGIACRYVDRHLSSTQQSQMNTVITKTEVTENFIKQLMVEPLRYQYFPNSTLDSIVGDNSINGLREQQIANKLLIQYFETCKEDYVTISNDANYEYKFDIISTNYAPYDGEEGMLNYVIKFRLTVDTDGDGAYDDVDVTKEVSFIIGFLTYNAVNNPKLNKTTGNYTEVPNTNVVTVTDTDGSDKNVFRLSPIKNENSDVIRYNQLVEKTVPAIISAVPYTKRENSQQVPYGDHRITIDGVDYLTNKSNITDLYSSSAKQIVIPAGSNYYFKGDITLSSSSYSILIKSKTVNGKKVGSSLFIDGNLTLKDDCDLTLEENAMIFVNGNFRIEYDVKTEMDYSTSGYGKTWRARALTADNKRYFQSHGVDVYAEPNAKIIVNGNFDYKGVKYKYAQSNSFNITIANDTSGLKMDRVYEQYVLNTGFGSGQDCTQSDSGTWTHYTDECRGALEGVYIVNGDIRFLASNEKLTTNKSTNKWYAMYSNAYSNPICNATFYAAGAFDMTGLWTAGLYDKCRANFVFAKSIVEPYLQLNTILCTEDPQYGGWKETDGYLFVICEEAVEFSKDSFGYVNLFTPFQELVNAINSHKTSETNFAQYISKGDFTVMFPNKEIVNDWGLPSILKSGFAQMYSPGDIGTIKPEDQFNGSGDPELGVTP